MTTPIRKLEISLLALRLSVAAVMLVWVVDKFVRPEHAVSVLEGFYNLPGVGETIVIGLGIFQLLLVLAFLVGAAKTWSYGAILLLHAASTFVSWRQYLAPFAGANILFFAAWPMLAACLALFLLRDQDCLWVIGKAQHVIPGAPA